MAGQACRTGHLELHYSYTFLHFQCISRSFGRGTSCGWMECAGLVRNYFNLGYNYNEIIASLLFNHNVAISKRTLNRKLRDLGLYRRKNHTDELDVACFILQELQSSGCLHGYRWMHLKCIQNKYFFVKMYHITRLKEL